MNETARMDTLRQILPKEVEKAFNLNSLGKKDKDDEPLTYELMKEDVLEFVLEYTPEPGKKSNANNAEEVNSLGAGPQGAAAGETGKGAGQAATAPGKGAQQPPGSCRICWKF